MVLLIADSKPVSELHELFGAPYVTVSPLMLGAEIFRIANFTV